MSEMTHPVNESQSSYLRSSEVLFSIDNGDGRDEHCLPFANYELNATAQEFCV